MPGRTLEKARERECKLHGSRFLRLTDAGGADEEWGGKDIPVPSCPSGMRTKRIWRRNTLRRCAMIRD